MIQLHFRRVCIVDEAVYFYFLTSIYSYITAGSKYVGPAKRFR